MPSARAAAEESRETTPASPAERLTRYWRRFREDERASGSGRAVFVATCAGIVILLLGLAV